MSNQTPPVNKNDVHEDLKVVGEQRMNTYISSLLGGMGVVVGGTTALIGAISSSAMAVNIGLAVLCSAFLVDATGTASMKSKVIAKEQELAQRFNDEKVNTEFAKVESSMKAHNSFSLKKAVVYVSAWPVALALNNMLQLKSETVLLGLAVACAALHIVKKMREKELLNNPEGAKAFGNSKDLLQNIAKRRLGLDYGDILKETFNKLDEDKPKSGPKM